jgi:hypothetical protein
MVRRNVHSMTQIESMRLKSLYSGIQRNCSTSVFPRFRQHPIEQKSSEPVSLGPYSSHKIIGIQKPTVHQMLKDSIAGHCELTLLSPED